MQTRIEAAHGTEEETFLSFRVSRIWRKCGQIEKKSQKTNIRTFFFIASDWRFEFTTKIHQRFTSFSTPCSMSKDSQNVLDHIMVETHDNDAHFGSGWASEPPTWPGHGARQCPLPRSSCVLLLLLSFHCAAREYSIKIDLYQHFFCWVTTHL